MDLGFELMSLQGGFLPRLVIDLVCVILLIRGIYYRAYKHADLFLTFFAFNLTIFLLAFVLHGAQLSMGAAFGLFAVFSMLRYRTEGISTTDMTYLFLVIALGLIMAISDAGALQLGLIGVTLLVCIQLLESGWLAKRELRQQVLYDNIELVKAQARGELLEDLRERTGLNIHRVEVQEIDLLKDAAKVTVYYYAKEIAVQAHEAKAARTRPVGTLAGQRQPA